MPFPRRSTAALAAALVAAACTGGSDDGGPAQRADPAPSPALLGTVDLDAAVDGDARLDDLAAGPRGDPVALLGDGGARTWLVDITPAADGPPDTTVREVSSVGEGAEIAVLPDGSVLVASTSGTAGYQLLTVPSGQAPATVTDLGLRPDRATTVLSADGRTLFTALSLPGVPSAQLVAIDLATVTLRSTAPAAATGSVSALAARPDGGLAALVRSADRAVLTEYDARLRPVGQPVPLATDVPTSSPADLAVTADGAVVATVFLGEARSRGRLVTVVGGAVHTSVDLDGAGNSALDLALAPDGRSASVPLADLSFPAELISVDLATGRRLGAVTLCPGAGVLGVVAPAADGRAVVVTGSCIDADGPQVTAFLVGPVG